MSKKRFQKYSGQVFTPLPEATSTNDIFARPTDATAPLKPAAAPAQKTLSKADQLESIVDSHASFPLKHELKQLLAAGSFRQSKTLLEDLIAKLQQLSAEQWSEFSFAGILNDLLKSRHCAGEALENVLLLFSKLVTKLDSGSRGQLELIPVLPAVLEKVAERDASLRKAAEDSISTFLSNTLPVLLAGPALTEFASLLTSNSKWQVKHRALLAIEQILQGTPDKFVTHRIADLTEDCLHTLTDLKPEVVKASSVLLKLLIEKTGNYDIVPQSDAIIKGLADVKNIPMALKTLSAVTFVAEVNRNVLSFLVPILHKALGGFSSQASLRQTVIILENLTRLLPDTRSIKPYVPILKPELQKVIETAAMPEIRSLAENTMSVIEKAEADFSKSSESEEIEACRAILTDFKVDSICSRVLSETLDVAIEAKDLADFEVVLSHMAIDDSGRAKLIDHLKEFVFANNEEEYEGDTPIVDVRFSLAYGGRMLLNQTRLLLYRGHRYGVLGHNGAGKSTLLRSIANGKVEGFPDRDTVKTYFLELKAASRSQDASILEYLHAAAPNMTIEDSQNALLDVGFTEDTWTNPVNNLSGGWRMKLEIAKAILERADILLLDEPTNHLDVSNVKWLENYLLSHTSLTTLIVSHDTGFLDNVCTDVIHYEQKTLQYYKGNVSDFVKVHPEAKSYYAFERSSTTKMAFPPPGILTGVRSVTRAVARLHNVTFTYPGAPKPNLTNVSCSIALNSRVAVIGPNGAGKSTLIKLLTGELIPSEGSIEKHPNLRIGYIAQHALEHVEKHKELTPNQYIQWRYRNGDDSEVHLKQSRQISDEEKAVVEKPIDVGDGGPERYFEAIVGRQKLKKSFRYELSWRGYLPRHNTFMSREELVERGFGKLVQAFDDHEASREGLSFRELHPAVIRKHFEEVGLDGDIADHTPMGSLSGGQLVKVVISGATWNNPHILVLDEPTNYLDRDSLAGLAIAIQNWSGGVIMISHNSEFVDALAKETWLVDNGQLKFSGKNGETPAESTQTSCTESVSEIEGSIANIKLRKKKKKLTRNEQKDREVRRRLRHLEWLSSPKGTPKPEDTDSD